MHIYALIQGALDFFRIGGHFLPASTVNNGDFLATESFGDPSRINRHVAATDHQNPVSRFCMVSKVSLPEEIHGIQNPLELILTRDICLYAMMGANRQKNGLKTLLLKVVQCKINTESLARLRFDAQPKNVVNFIV